MGPRNYSLNQGFLEPRALHVAVVVQVMDGKVQVFMVKVCKCQVCRDKVAWELEVKMPKVALVEVKKQV